MNSKLDKLAKKQITQKDGKTILIYNDTEDVFRQIQAEK